MTQSQRAFQAQAGEFLRHYKPRLTFHRAINSFRTTSAVIVRGVQFPDVSFYQGEIDYEIMRGFTLAIILRAGQNLWIDSQFERNYREAKRKQMRVGVYWFYDDRIDPGRQADLLLSALHGKTLEMEVFIDWENSYGGAFGGLPNVVAMMQKVEAAGYTVGMYTGYYWFREHSNSITHASQYNYLRSKRLWLAWYSQEAANVLIPAPWTSLHHWQFGTPAVQWGQQSREIDMNYFNGTVDEFDRLYVGGTTMQGKVKSGYTLTIRDSVGVDTGKRLFYNDTVYGLVSNGRISFSKVYRANGTVEPTAGNAATVSPTNSAEAFMVLSDVSEPVSTMLKHTIKIYSDGSYQVDDGPIVS